ncbi:ATP-binding cassette domain-containing protein [Clostridium niameyense]|uniref:ATP-binding cassette domain-containing protein n=1 Tax=Clostridium niameyense TaxID=1622073 RepID=A0A6M0R9B0_9CLOT|nr:ATP-binding cassette domain-containing protein [Clostridium niameyense]NEZ46854.1 ATP-binding cassette domain-containing protein [Clostridium niameyense]
MFIISNLSLSISKFSLKNINLTLNSGEYFVLLGKSGVGKTVFLETIAGRYNIGEGSMKFQGQELSTLSPEKRGIGFVYQNYELFPHMRVSENIGFALKLRKFPKKEIEYKIDEMLETLSISYLKNRYPKNLSGGEKQRVAIARALIIFPKLLLLDEPMSALDYLTKDSLKIMLKDIHIKFNPTVIHVTHDIDEALFFADKIGIMKNNTISNVLSVDASIKSKGREFLYEYI